jgi:hypothetical protein
MEPAATNQPRRESANNRINIDTFLPIKLAKHHPNDSAGHTAPARKDEINTIPIKVKVTAIPKLKG